MARPKIDVRKVKIGDKLVAYCRRGSTREELKQGWVVGLTTTHVRLFNPYIKGENGAPVDHPTSCEWFAMAGKRAWVEEI